MDDFIVLRAHPDLPEDFLPPEMDGLWLDKGKLPREAFPDAVAVPSGKFEFRDDGACAEVYQLRP